MISTTNKWFPSICNNSTLIKIKYVSSFSNGFSFDSNDFDSDGLYNVIRIGDLINEKINITDCAKVNFIPSTLFKVKNNDILIAMSGATIGKIAIATSNDVNCFINQRVGVVRSCYIKNIYYSFLTSKFEEYVNYVNTGSAQPNISGSQILNFPIILHKNNLIFDYLDKKTLIIESLIDKEEKNINELRDFKQSLITKIVLNGLNNKNFKETNIKWMPSIPKHWSFTKVGANCYLKGRIGWQGLTTDEYKDTGPYLITGTDFNNGKINWNTCVHITERRYNEASHIRVKIGDVLITKDGTVGKVAIIDNLPDKASLNSGVMLMRNINNKYLNKYLYYVLLSNVFWDWFYRDKKENSTIIHLYQEQFEKFSFPIPPKDEQQQIVDYLDKKCDVIDSLIKLKEQKIEKLKEYKKSLIYECVTGRREITCQMN